MARKYVYEDDLTGEELEGDNHNEIKFSYRGKHYIIDLSDESLKKMDKSLKRYVEAAREDLEAQIGPARQTSTRNTRSGTGDSALIRAWAKENGLEVGDRGRIHPDIIEAYRKAQNGEPVNPPKKGKAPEPEDVDLDEELEELEDDEETED